MYSETKMHESINSYLQEISAKYNSGHAVEHAYRPALQRLIESFNDIEAVNDPARSEHGAPDFIFLKQSNPKIIKGYAEAKDIGKNLDKVEVDEQMQRYAGYTNLFLTDYLEFRFMKNGEKYQTVKLGELNRKKLQLYPENGERLTRELHDFFSLAPERITSGERLATIMGAKARRIRDNVREYLKGDVNTASDLLKIFQLMRQMLVHDLSKDKFSDMYAQTLVYGLFVARYGDTSPDTFTRAEARDLVPKSNPFLREFFDHIAGTGFDARLAKIVDELCDIFQVSDVMDIVHKHLRIQDITVAEKDPIIHFYEDFLKAYDPVERKRMGAYYTPIPVVKFIVRSIDKILKEDFEVIDGLASNEMIKYQVDVGQDMRDDRRRKLTTMQTLTVPRVQILDPAVGTATFLNEVIKYVHGGFDGQEGRWPAYARDNLVKRLYGFELMMAPYTIAHLKLGMTLKELGVEDLPTRLNVFLTNTLEEGVPVQPDLFSFGLAEAVSEESRLAAEVKTEKPVMVVVGNPPYSSVSSNETDFANELVKKYKVEPGGQVKLQERKHWLNDDYVKFIAFAEQMVAKNGSGVVAMITNNGYLDNASFRGMRWHLAKMFDKIYVLDLHGNPKKREVSPDGGKDENVFDIMQGVGILIAVKNGKKLTEFATVFHSDLYGKRPYKFGELNRDDVRWTEINLNRRNFYFVPRGIEGADEYNAGVGLEKLFIKTSSGIVTMGDKFIVAPEVETVASRVQSLIAGEYDELKMNSQFGLGKNYAKFALQGGPGMAFDESKLAKINYRPFDCQWTYFDNRVLWRWRENVMRNFLRGPNVGLSFERSGDFSKGAVLVNESLIAHGYSFSNTASIVYTAPLYIYHDDGARTENFDPNVLATLTRNLSVEFSAQDILDYIYGVLHSPTYREVNREHLREGFPKVPTISGDAEFLRLVALGAELRQLHLMRSTNSQTLVTTYPQSGNNIVDKYSFSNGRIYINDTQYFGNVPEGAWSFYIGGYQPAQKWLKDRKGLKLSDGDLIHYQRIIKVVVETQRIMDEIG